jgi:prepilin-type processing-associated H-X9-DG protein
VQIEQYWFQDAMIGRYIPTHVKLSDSSIAGGVMVCPAAAAEGDVLRSYAMNVFASGYVSTFVRQEIDADPPRAGKLFKLGAAPSAQLILAVEAQLELQWPNPMEVDAATGKPKVPVGRCPEAVIGFSGLPGQRFGAGGGVNRTSRLGPLPTQVNFANHRVIQKVEPLKKGRANFGFLDGHVAALSPGELADFDSGKSRYAALWSQIDREIDQLEPGTW